MKPWIIEGQGDYGVRFCTEVFRCSVHSSIAALIGHESLTQGEWLKLADNVQKLDVSRFSAAPGARLGHFSFESDGAFQPKSECRRRGL